MKGIFVVIDGLGDLPNKQLGEMTPLEAADTPNMDFLAARGELGMLYPVKPGFTPESDESLMSIFSNDLVFSTRGYLEALGAGFDMTRGDLALRANFATIDNLLDGNLLDRRAGRTLTGKEIDALSKDINKINLSTKFFFQPTVQHQAVLILKGGFSDNVLANDPTYIQGKTHQVTKIKMCQALDEEENTHYTANILNDFLKKSHEVLHSHPVNEERRKRGLLPTNYILLRGMGIEPPKLKQYKDWLSVSYFPLEMGFSKLSGMRVFSFGYPRLKGLDSYENLWDGLKEACDFSIKTLNKNHKDFDYAYIHINEPDIAGHDNKPIEKKMMLEHIDKTLFKFLREFAPQNKIKVLVTGNHSTPCKLKDHSADPVPILFYNDSIPRERKFNEKEALLGSLGRIFGKDLLNKVEFDK